MTTTEAPALIHYQDCDDLALGRYVRDAVPYNLDANRIVRNAGNWPTSAVINAYRGACDCARLRGLAAATQQTRIRKAAAARAHATR